MIDEALTPTVSGAFLSLWMTSVTDLALSESDWSVRESAVCNNREHSQLVGRSHRAGGHTTGPGVSFTSV